MLVERVLVLLSVLGFYSLGVNAEHDDNSTISRNFWIRLSSVCPNMV